MWAQKARCDWTLFADRNKRYFQTIVKQRRAKSRILHIKDREGDLTDKIDEIEDILVNHFKFSYEDPNSNSVDSILHELQSLHILELSTQRCYDLNRPITSIEIDDVVFQLEPHKAPGLDGIPTFFFQEYWSTVKTDIINTVQAFFHLGSLFKPLNHTYITLIPKYPYPNDVTHFRPISLCNTL